jgi:hypothetical protein
MALKRHVRRFDTVEPKNAAERIQLCGFNASAMEAYWDKNAGEHATFFLAQQTEPPPDTVRLWTVFQSVTNENPDISPQPTGNCVAAAAADAVEFLQCSEIADGEAEEFRRIYNPYHYATGRVLVMKNSLRGQAGASGGAVAEALTKYGVIEIQAGLPKYNKTNVDAWGDGRSADGKDFRTFMEAGAKNLVKTTSRIDSMGHVFEALGSKYPLTIASNRGYSMLPDREGFHKPSGSWSHQMSIVGYSKSRGWIAIKNQWGDLHGDLKDFETGEEWPPGLLRVRIEDFEKYHFKGSETISYSRFVGYPQRRFDHSLLS